MAARLPDVVSLTGELVLACAFLDPLPTRLDRVRVATRAPVDWSIVVALLESHGILLLACRNLALAGARLPDAVADALAARATALRELDLRFHVTIERLLAECARDGVEITLLKGASLARDLYAGEPLRSQGDLDVLVHPRDVQAALAAAARCGLLLGERALPVWWYRLSHFHLKLVPTTTLVCETELHWALHHSSELRTVGFERLLGRRVATDAGGVRAWALDRLDRFLHLVTHLARHRAEAPLARDSAALRMVAATPGHPVRLKWIVDIVGEVGALHDVIDPRAFRDRASEWNAETELIETLDWLAAAVGFDPRAAAWVARCGGFREVGGGVEKSESVGTRSPDSLSAIEHAAADRSSGGSVAARRRGRRPLSVLDFRLTALARLPRWIVPPRWYFRRIDTTGEETPGAEPGLTIRRVAHAARVLTRVIFAAAAFPAALVAAAVARPFRRRARVHATSPAQVLDLVAALRVGRRSTALESAACDLRIRSFRQPRGTW